MTYSKRILIALCTAGAIFGGAQASSSFLAGFDYSLLKPLVARSKQAVDAIEQSLNATKSACIDTKAWAKNLYEQQKNALKLIKVELKQAYKVAKASGVASWLSQKQLYKAYKKLVYKNWKKTRLFPTV